MLQMIGKEQLQELNGKNQISQEELSLDSSFDGGPLNDALRVHRIHVLKKRW